MNKLYREELNFNDVGEIYYVYPGKKVKDGLHIVEDDGTILELVKFGNIAEELHLYAMKEKVKSAQESTKHYCLESEDSIVPSGDSDSGSNDEVGDDINDSKDSQHGVELLEVLPSFMEEENHDEIQTLSSHDLGSFNDGCETNSESVFPRIRSSHPKFDWEANNPQFEVDMTFANAEDLRRAMQ
ncbi:hypothetical protein Sjap_015235 [Stephania japonica]|uniref:Uncharacterized protein n=1 Tax=Stephania japonica TaxID=461633 RepID=A0AAP0NR66_9MAGN